MMTPADFELLSAYLDNALNSRERSALEARLAQDAALRAALDELRGIKSLLGDLPVLQPPRNFTLDPTKYARRVWWSRLDAFRTLGALVSAAAALMLVFGVLSSANQVQPATSARASGTLVGANPTALPATPTLLSPGSEGTPQEGQGSGEAEFNGAAESQLSPTALIAVSSQTASAPALVPPAASTVETFQLQQATGTPPPTATDHPAIQGILAATSVPQPTLAAGAVDQATLSGADDAMRSATLANQNLLMTPTAAVDIVQTSAALAPLSPTETRLRATTEAAILPTAAGAPLLTITSDALSDAAEPIASPPPEPTQSPEADKSRRDETGLEPQSRLLILGGIILFIVGGVLFLIGIFRTRN